MLNILIYIIFFLALFFSLSLLANFAKNIVALSRAHNMEELIKDGLLMNRLLVLVVSLLWTTFYIVTNLK